MGCTSSKPKRTKSLEDVKGQTQNGQITKEDTTQKKPVQDKSSANPIQIPGANKSFQAPDGIPFIDEDVDEEDARIRTGIRENSKKMEDDSRNSALVVNSDSGVRLSTGGAKVSAGGVKVSGVGDVMVNEKGVHVIGEDGSVVPIKKGPAPSPKFEEQPPRQAQAAQEKAAVKIQAGIRGYLDRKKVQDLKKQKQDPKAACNIAVKPPTIEVQQIPIELDIQQPKFQQQHEFKYDENMAATKIQANFKGYKARKELAATKK